MPAVGRRPQKSEKNEMEQELEELRQRVAELEGVVGMMVQTMAESQGGGGSMAAPFFPVGGTGAAMDLSELNGLTILTSETYNSSYEIEFGRKQINVAADKVTLTDLTPAKVETVPHTGDYNS